MMRFAAPLLGGLFLIVPAGAAMAQVAVAEIRAQIFLERSGKLSDNLIGANKALHNTVIGEGDAGEPAEAVLVTLIFTGAKNAKSSDKIARDHLLPDDPPIEGSRNDSFYDAALFTLYVSRRW